MHARPTSDAESKFGMDDDAATDGVTTGIWHWILEDQQTIIAIALTSTLHRDSYLQKAFCYWDGSRKVDVLL